jgi:hypothetical protein
MPQTLEERRAYCRAYDAAHREERKVAARERRSSRPREVLAVQLRSKYDITLEQYDALIEAQGQVCACCGKKPAKWHVDHCHATNKIRGLLCGKCNKGLGFFGDDLEGFDKPIAYLQSVEQPFDYAWDSV